MQPSSEQATEMMAAVISSYDGPGAVTLQRVSRPEPAANEVVVRVLAAGVAFPEVLQTRGRYQIQPAMPFVPGSEVAGELVRVPDGYHLGIGERVIAYPRIGGFSEYAVARSDLVFPLPPELTCDHGAGMLLNYCTAHYALLRRGRLVPGERVLVHGAAGGLGSAAVQVARAFGAAEVIAVVSTPEKEAVAAAAGATQVVSALTFAREVEECGGVDVVVDIVGGDRFDDSVRALRPHGRLLVMGFAEGAIPTVKVNRLLLRNIDLVGVGWGHHALDHRDYVAEQWRELLPHIRSGALRPPVTTTFPLANVNAALRLIEDRRAVGKVVLTIDPDCEEPTSPKEPS